MEFVVRVRDNQNHVTWEKRYDNIKKAKKARRWLENDMGYPVSIEEAE